MSVSKPVNKHKNITYCSPTFGTERKKSLENQDFRKNFSKVVQKSFKNLMEKPLFKPAKLYDCGGDVSPGREWYFHFYILQKDGTYKRCLERFDINRKRGKNDNETRKLRYAYARVVLNQLNEWLESGKYTEEKTAAKPDFMPVERAIRYAMELKEAKGLRKRSLQTYQNAADRYLEYLHHTGTNNTAIAELSKKHIQQYADWLALSRNISNLSKNKYITHLRAIMAELVERELIKSNPCSNMGKLREDIGEKNIPLSADELLKLKMELPGIHPRLWMFSLLIYYGYMRSQEICQLKAGMIDFQNGFIHLPASVAKTRVTRMVKLMPEMVTLLKKMGVDQLPSNTFLFSKRITLDPGNTPLVRNRVSELWKEVVKDGIGIQKDMYALKHTSAKLFILNGGSKEALQAQMGHSSIVTTEIYIKRITPQESLNRFFREFKSGLL